MNLNYLIVHLFYRPPWWSVQVQTRTPHINLLSYLKTVHNQVRTGPECIPQFSEQVIILRTVTTAVSNFHCCMFPGLRRPLSVRYPQDHLDVQHSTGMMAPSYDYGHSMSAQQPPILDTSLELPNTSARVPFSPQYSVSTRNQLGIDFPVQSPVNSRIPPVHGVPPVSFRYSPPGERRLPPIPTHDHSYAQQAEQSSGAIVDDDRCPADSSDSRLETTLATSTPSSSSKSAKRESTNVVIACRQW